MNLPNLTGRTPTRRQEITFGGLNLTDGARAGELREAENVSMRRYPVLSPRRGRKTHDANTSSSVFEWDGKLVEVRGTSLYYGTDLVGTVTAGKKQFAVVNTKLCIFPDKVFVDLTKTPKTIETLAPEYQTAGLENSVVITHNSLTAQKKPVVARVADENPLFTISSSDVQDGYLYVYGLDKDAVAECYDAENGWDLTALGDLEVLAGVCYPATGSSSTRLPAVGDVIIPGDPYTDLVTGNYSYLGGVNNLPDKSDYNGEGYYAAITDVVAEENPDDQDETFYFIKYDVFKVGNESAAFSSVFKTGRGVDISGSLYGMGDAEKAFIKGIDDESNSLIFADNTFFIPTACAEIASDFYPNAGDDGWLTFSFGDDDYPFQLQTGECIPGGTVACITDGTSIYIWSPTEKRIVKEYVVDTTPGTAGREISGDVYDTSEEIITIQVPVPSFDFICESNNRLWGVSNSQTNTLWNAEAKKFETFTSRCIYASALGEPDDFWTFEGLSTDAWQVAVGSEGDFTGLCAYDGVLAWKEQKLYRVSGSYPAEYYLFDRDVEGVQKGSGDSLVVIDETLYYKGRDGAYAYRGGVPQLVSAVFGNERYSAAVAGTDGQRYYVSMKGSDNKYNLYVYDTLTNLWTREDETQAVQFCQLNGKMLMLKNDGVLLELDDDGWSDPAGTVTWKAVFAPFDERDMHERQYYLRILLRVSVSEGNSIAVYARKNGTAWPTTPLQTMNVAGDWTVVVPMFPYRMDELQIKLEGTGDTAVLSLAREYRAGSIYGKEGVAP